MAKYGVDQIYKMLSISSLFSHTQTVPFNTCSCFYLSLNRNVERKKKQWTQSQCEWNVPQNVKFNTVSARIESSILSVCILIRMQLNDEISAHNTRCRLSKCFFFFFRSLCFFFFGSKNKSIHQMFNRRMDEWRRFISSTSING